MKDPLDDIHVERAELDGQTIWKTVYRGADVAVIAEFDEDEEAILHHVFIDESEKPRTTLGMHPPPAIYKTVEAAGDAGLRRAMAYLDRAPLDTRTPEDF